MFRTVFVSLMLIFFAMAPATALATLQPLSEAEGISSDPVERLASLSVEDCRSRRIVINETGSGLDPDGRLRPSETGSGLDPNG